MQNKRTIWVFTILLSLACIYQISFSFVTSAIEKKAVKVAKHKMDSLLKTGDSVRIGTQTFNLKEPEDLENLRIYLEEDYLRSVAHKPAYPVTNKTYQQCKASEMGLGLDLKGGMAVTLEVSIPDLVENLAGKSKNEDFRKAFDEAKKEHESTGKNFIELFEKSFNKNSADKSLASIFYLGNKNKFKPGMTNKEVLDILKNESKDAIDRTEIIISNRINKFGVTEPLIQKQPLTGRLQIELPGVKDRIRVEKLLQSTANLEFWETYDAGEVFEKYFTLANEVLANKADGIAPADTSAKVPADTSATDGAGIASTDTTDLGELTNEKKEVKKDKADKKDTKELANKNKKQPIFDVLSPEGALAKNENGQLYYLPGAQVGVCKLSDTTRLMAMLRDPMVSPIWDARMRFVWGAKTIQDEKQNETDKLPLYVLKAQPNGGAALSGDIVTDASQDYDQQNMSRVVVNMQMNDEGAESWRLLTKANSPDQKGKHAIAIVLDNVVYSAPTVEGEIPGGRSVIQGNFTPEEATDLANILKAGSLPARAKIVDFSLVGATLGEENIKMGFFSFIISFILILIYMIAFYRKAGLVANIALLANVFFLIGALASVQATLTLPGIAGIVLTLGTAVDGNVLIYERIKEHLREGKSVKQAIADGFKGSYATIIDANVTNLLIAIVLATFGSGSIRGFAVTLIIGIFTSVFTSVFITRMVVSYFMEKRKSNMTFSYKWSENFLANTNINFVKRRKVYYLISGLVIVIGVTSLAVRSLDYSVEFTGGTTFKVKFETPPDYDKVKTALGDVFLDEDGKRMEPEVKLVNNKYWAKITTNYLYNQSNDTIVQTKIENKLKAGLKDFGAFKVEETRRIDSSISSAFIKGAVLSVILSVLIMFLYIVIRFRKWQYGVGTALALFHDVAFVVGMYSLLHGIMPFTMEVDQAFIAAILTIMGYSVNDTVVVFDRIREYMNMGRKESQEVLINEALNSTLSRTVNNSLTIFVVLLAIFIFGPESIQGFTFALLVGVFVGTYSSICIATPVLIDFGKKSIGIAKK